MDLASSALRAAQGARRWELPTDDPSKTLFNLFLLPKIMAAPLILQLALVALVQEHRTKARYFFDSPQQC